MSPIGEILDDKIYHPLRAHIVRILGVVKEALGSASFFNYGNELDIMMLVLHFSSISVFNPNRAIALT